MKSFSQYLTEETKEVVFTFGRFNPPTNGHEKLISKVASLAKGNNYRIYASKSQDPKKNPLDFNTKIKYMRKMFPKHGRNIMSDKDVRNALDILVKLYDQGFTKVTMVVGSDRVNEFSALTNKYNGVSSRHGMYNFQDGINVVSAGERDPDSDDVSGMSASKMRAAAASNDYGSFAKGLPSGFKDGKGLFDNLRKAMGIKEASEYKNHVQLEPVSELREAYIKQRIFEEGEQVVITDKGIVGTITKLGANYLVVESKGETWRCWLDQVSKVDPNEESILALASEVEPAPHSLGEGYGPHKDYEDMTAKEKEKYNKPRDNAKKSKYTKRFKDMFGEKRNEINEADAKKALQKKADQTGISYSILKKVFDRGYAAWKTSHRPGTNPTQWGLARVNSFATGGKTQKTADADLWKKHKEGK